MINDAFGITSPADGNVSTMTMISRALREVERNPHLRSQIEDVLFAAVEEYAPRIDALITKTVISGGDS